MEVPSKTYRFVKGLMQKEVVLDYNAKVIRFYETDLITQYNIMHSKSYDSVKDMMEHVSKLFSAISSTEWKFVGVF